MFEASERTVVSGRIGLAMSTGTAFGQVGSAATSPFCLEPKPSSNPVAIACVVLTPCDPRVCISSSSQLLAGALGPTIGWRAPFIVVSVLMLALAAAIRPLMREPPRRRANGQTAAATRGSGGGGGGKGGALCAASVRGWCAIFCVPTVLLVFLQGLPGCVPWGVIGTFLPDYLHSNCGYSVGEASFVMACFSLGGFAGNGPP